MDLVGQDGGRCHALEPNSGSESNGAAGGWCEWRSLGWQSKLREAGMDQVSYRQGGGYRLVED